MFFSKASNNYIVARFVTQLKYGVDSLTFDNRLQASHTCGNRDCEWHVYPESDIENKSRDLCHQIGCAKTCPHRLLPIEPCVFQRDGIYLNCRNNPELDKCIESCEKDCFRDGLLFLFKFLSWFLILVDITKFQSKQQNSRKRKSNVLDDDQEEIDDDVAVGDDKDQNEEGEQIPYSE